MPDLDLKLILTFKFKKMIYVAQPYKTESNTKLDKILICHAKNKAEMKQKGMNMKLYWEKMTENEVAYLKNTADCEIKETVLS